MEKITELAKEKKIKVLRNLREGDRIEVTYAPDGDFWELPVIKCFYFVDWKVFEKIIMVADTKFQNPSHPFTTLPLGHITEIQKLIPTR